ncbi:hypothetical protein ACROYT_G004950 [Oculina patagonica]
METATVFYFQQAELSNDGSYTMYCPKHKRSFDGPGRIRIDAETHANVTTCIDYVRNVCVNDNEEALFITLEGNAKQNRQVNNRLLRRKHKRKHKRDTQRSMILFCPRDGRVQCACVTKPTEKRAVRRLRRRKPGKEGLWITIYNIGHITKKSSKCHQLLKKTLGLDRSVLTRSKASTKSANSTKSNNEDHEESTNEEGLTSSQIEAIKMLFSHQLISRDSLTFDIVGKTSAEHMDLREFLTTL